MCHNKLMNYWVMDKNPFLWGHDDLSPLTDQSLSSSWITFRRRELSVMRVMEGEGFSFLECYIIIYINILGDQPTSI